MPKRLVDPIEAERIRLRLLQQSDLPTTCEWRNRPEIRRWFFHSDLISDEQHLAWWRAYSERDDDFMFVIEETSKLCRPIGQVAVYNVNWRAGMAEFGRLMIADPRARGLGLAKAAVQALSAAWATMGISRLRLEVLESNQPARAVYCASGFVEACHTGGVITMERRESIKAEVPPSTQ